LKKGPPFWRGVDDAKNNFKSNHENGKGRKHSPGNNSTFGGGGGAKTEQGREEKKGKEAVPSFGGDTWPERGKSGKTYPSGEKGKKVVVVNILVV